MGKKRWGGYPNQLKAEMGKGFFRDYPKQLKAEMGNGGADEFIHRVGTKSFERFLKE